MTTPEDLAAVTAAFGKLSDRVTAELDGQGVWKHPMTMREITEAEDPFPELPPCLRDEHRWVVPVEVDHELHYAWAKERGRDDVELPLTSVFCATCGSKASDLSGKRMVER